MQRRSKKRRRRPGASGMTLEEAQGLLRERGLAALRQAVAKPRAKVRSRVAAERSTIKGKG